MIAVDWITSSYPYLPRSPERTEGWKDINLISEHGNYPASASPAHMAHTSTLCFVARQVRTCNISASFVNGGCFSCLQVTNHLMWQNVSFIYIQTVLFCSRYLILFASVDQFVGWHCDSSPAVIRWQEIARVSPDLCSFYTPEKFHAEKSVCQGRVVRGVGWSLYLSGFPLFLLIGFLDDIRKNHLVHWRDIIEFHTRINGGQLWEWMVLL